MVAHLGNRVIHLIVILSALNLAGMDTSEGLSQWFQRVWRTYRDPAIMVLFGYGVSVWLGGSLIRAFLDRIAPFRGMDEGLQDAGRRIGQLERFLVTTLTILDQYSAIAFVFAAKSIARFKKIEETPMFAEYYLAGTLASVSLAILVGLGIKAGLALIGSN